MDQLVDGAPEAELVPVSFKQGRASLPRLSEPYVAGIKSNRYWTDADDLVMRQYYPSGGYLACAAHLPSNKRSRAQIFARAHKLGLHSEKRIGGPKQRIQVPADIDDKIREAWPNLDGKKRGAVDALARELGVPDWWLSKRAVKLGLAMPYKKEPPWTAAETALLSQVPLHDPRRASQIFHQHGFPRTPAAIMVRAKRIGLSRRFREGLSAHQAAEIIGVDSKTLGTYCAAGELKASRRADNRLPQQGGARWVIKPEDLRRYVLDNLERVDLRRVEKFAFVKLLTMGSEPELEEAPPPAAAFPVPALVSSASIDAIRKQAAVVHRLLGEWL